jgi:tellurite resistance protein
MTDGVTGSAAQAAQPPSAGMPTGLITLFAVPLGLAGLGGDWGEAEAVVDAPGWVADATYTLAAAIWLLMTLAYVAQGLRNRGALGRDLGNPATGPLVAYPAVIGLLLVPHLSLYAHTAAEWACGVFVTTLVLIVASLLANLLRGNVPLQAVHPGFFLPYVAGASIAGIALAGVGAPTAAMTAIGAGLFFWVVISALLFTRLATQEALPQAAQPLFSVLLASPATAGIGWLAANGDRIDPLVDALAGFIILLVLVQFMLFPVYRRGAFTPGFWAFAFPIASTTNFGMRWLAALHVANLDAWAWLLTSLATVSIAALAARSLAFLAASRRPSRT